MRKRIRLLPIPWRAQPLARRLAESSAHAASRCLWERPVAEPRIRRRKGGRRTHRCSLPKASPRRACAVLCCPPFSLSARPRSAELLPNALAELLYGLPDLLEQDGNVDPDELAVALAECTVDEHGFDICAAARRTAPGLAAR